MLTKIPGTQVRIIDIAKIFNKPMIDIRLFNEDYDVVFAAIERDVLTRGENRDIGINIVLGIGQYKKTLSKPGLEIFDNMMNHLVESKNNIFIFIDNYDKLRMLKMEQWYSMVNTTKGIWLGNGFDSQSLISSNEVSVEDKKYKYEGLAYSVDNANYTVIKTVMDGED